MGSRGVAASLRTCGLFALATLVLASQALAVSYSINIYNNAGVIGSKPISDTVLGLLKRLKITVSGSKLSTSQPSAAELASTNAFIIYASSKGSYWGAEGLATNSTKLNDLISWVRAGGSLVLVNGVNGTSNTFIPLITAIVGSSSNCVSRSYVDGTRIYLRLTPPSIFGSLPIKYFRFSAGDALTGLDCNQGVSIYSSDPTKKLYSISAAITWRVGNGAVTWNGADIAADPASSVGLVTAAAVVVDALPSPPSPPGSRSPPSLRSPPPLVRSPPPKRPSVASPPPPSPLAKSSPPPEPRVSPSPPPRSPPPRASPPPPSPSPRAAASPPPPPPSPSPPRVSPSPPPPTVSPSPPPRASPSPPAPVTSSPPPRPPPPSPPPPPPPPSPPPRASPSPPPPVVRTSPPPPSPAVRASPSPPPSSPGGRGIRNSPPAGTGTKKSPPPPADDAPPPDYGFPPPQDLAPPPPKKKTTGRR